MLLLPLLLLQQRLRDFYISSYPHSTPALQSKNPFLIQRPISVLYL